MNEPSLPAEVVRGTPATISHSWGHFSSWGSREKTYSLHKKLYLIQTIAHKINILKLAYSKTHFTLFDLTKKTTGCRNTQGLNQFHNRRKCQLMKINGYL